MALSAKLPWELANPKWASELNPVLAMPMLNGNQINNVSLAATTPLAINHLLGRVPQGWFLTDNTGNAVIWRTKAFSQYTITLEASSATTISLWVF